MKNNKKNDNQSAKNRRKNATERSVKERNKGKKKKR